VKVATIAMFRYTTVNYREKMLRLLILLLEVSVVCLIFHLAFARKSERWVCTRFRSYFAPFSLRRQGKLTACRQNTFAFILHVFILFYKHIHFYCTVYVY